MWSEISIVWILVVFFSFRFVSWLTAFILRFPSTFSICSGCIFILYDKARWFAIVQTLNRRIRFKWAHFNLNAAIASDASHTKKSNMKQKRSLWRCSLAYISRQCMHKCEFGLIRDSGRCCCCGSVRCWNQLCCLTTTARISMRGDAMNFTEDAMVYVCIYLFMFLGVCVCDAAIRSEHKLLCSFFSLDLIGYRER